MKRHGFTLVECLVVVIIIAIVAALLIPAISAARDAALRRRNGGEPVVETVKDMPISTTGSAPRLAIVEQLVFKDVGTYIHIAIVRDSQTEKEYIVSYSGDRTPVFVTPKQ